MIMYVRAMYMYRLLAKTIAIRLHKQLLITNSIDFEFRQSIQMTR